MDYIIRDFRDNNRGDTEYRECADNKTIFSQFRYICKAEGIVDHKGPWEQFERYISQNYCAEITLYASSDDAELTCRLCGHHGCKSLYEATNNSEEVYTLSETCRIKLPRSVICGSECIGIPLKMRELMLELREYSDKVRLINGKLDIKSLMAAQKEPFSVYLPERMCEYTWPADLYCTVGEFKWVDWHKLELKVNRKSGRRPKMWKVTTYTKPNISFNFDYMLHIH